MNIGYIFDFNNIIKPNDLHIPTLNCLHYLHTNLNSFSINDLIQFRDATASEKYTGKRIEKHIFFFVVNNEKQNVKLLSNLISTIQMDGIHFNQDGYDIHVMCNFTDEEGFGIKEYESNMPCLKNNSVCVFSWLIDKYDYEGYNPITDDKRSHAIMRIAWFVCKHRRQLPVRHMNDDGMPIYNLFGDSSICFDEEARIESVRNYYSYKNLQHMLNLSDKNIDEYYKTNIVPYLDDKDKLDTSINTTYNAFIRAQAVKIEASKITEQTQGLLLKSSDDDMEYLVNVTDNNLVFLDDLSKNIKWDMSNADIIFSDYSKSVEFEKSEQEYLSTQFISDLSEEYLKHIRITFNDINNKIFKARKKQADAFKKHANKFLLKFLNKNDDENYNALKNTLLDQDVKEHRSNIDYGIAFMDYLTDGGNDYLVDCDVAVGDINLNKIKLVLEEEEKSRLNTLKSKEKEVRDKFKEQEDGKPSVIKKKFDDIDETLAEKKRIIEKCEFQLEHWIDPEAEKNKWTAKLKTWLGTVASIVAGTAFVMIRAFCINGIISRFISIWNLIAVLVIAAGCAYSYLKFYLPVKKQREAALKAEKKAKHDKIDLMSACVKDYKMIVERRFKHLLSYHGLKTLNELMEYSYWGKKDLESFKKSVFKQMLDYLSKYNKEQSDCNNDFNTILLKDNDAASLLFGPNKDKDVAYCFADEKMVSDSFEEYRRNKALYETTRFGITIDDNPIDLFDKSNLDNEIIPARQEDYDKNIVYTELNAQSLLPTDTSGVEMEDVKQGSCGDCYFLATLASIANRKPEYIIGKKGMVEDLGTEHKYFRIKFYNKDGKRFNVDVDNKFWNILSKPFYAGVGKSSDNNDAETYDPWVMAVEKAWAKVNDAGYDGIEGHNLGMRKIDYSYAVTGESAFYCYTQNVQDKNVLLEMMRKHFNENKLPITLYSADANDTAFSNTDPNIVKGHAYALKAVNGNTFDIFNPWNNHPADEDVHGKHYTGVDIDFIVNNFDVVVFFGIKEAEFDTFERVLTNNMRDDVLNKELECIINKKFENVEVRTTNFSGLITNDVLEKANAYASYMFSRNKLIDEGGSGLVFYELTKNDEIANKIVNDFLSRKHSRLADPVKRDDDKHIITIFRLSPQFLSSNFK